jgi:hypothetical protein
MKKNDKIRLKKYSLHGGVLLLGALLGFSTAYFTIPKPAAVVSHAPQFHLAPLDAQAGHAKPSVNAEKKNGKVAAPTKKKAMKAAKAKKPGKAIKTSKSSAKSKKRA